MVKIPLTYGKFAIVDDEFAHLSNWKWQAIKRKNGLWHAGRCFRKDDGSRGLIYMQWAIIGQPLDRKLVTDHRNGDGLLNSQKNLRHVTRSENNINTKKRREGKTSSMYAGVHWNKHAKKWMAQIIISKKRKYLGIFTEEKDAGNAYKEALIHG